MKKNKSTQEVHEYKTLKDTYPVLKNTAAIPRISEALGISPQGFRQKCIGPQYFNPGERDLALGALDELIEQLNQVREAIQGMPTRR